MSTFKRYYTTEEAAAYLNLAVGTLGNMRTQNRGPKFYKPEGGKPMYDRDDLDAWVKGGTPDAKE